MITSSIINIVKSIEQPLSLKNRVQFESVGCSGTWSKSGVNQLKKCLFGFLRNKIGNEAYTFESTIQIQVTPED